MNGTVLQERQAPPAPAPKKQWQATDAQKRADRDADFLCKYMRPVPSKLLDPIDKQIMDELVRADIWAQERDEQGRPRVNFKTIALKLGVEKKTISRRWHDRLTYSNLIKSAAQDGQSDRWYILVDRGLYERAARAYHAAYKVAADSGQKIVDPELLTFREHVAQRGKSAPECDTPKCKTKVARRRVTRAYTWCPKCKKRHKRLVHDTGWILPPKAHNEEPAQEPPAPVDDPSGQLVPHIEKHLPPLDALVDFFSELAAGEDETSIEMIATSQKYTTRMDKLSREQIEAHLDGSHTYGTRMWRADGLTRGFLVDGDSKAAIERLEQGASKLLAAGFFPIREYIPEDRPREVAGYHSDSRRFLIVMDALVDARAGWKRIFEIAPEWEGLECWPMVGATPKGNRTRLPGGLYRMPNYAGGWCELYSLSDCESSSNGLEAAALLYTHQSSAALIPPLPEPVQAPPEVESSEQEETAPLPERGNEQLLAAQSDNPHFLIAFAPCDLAARFNSEHDLADYLERGRNGKYFSPNGQERTPSSAVYYKDGRELFTDFSTHGTRPDGTHDTGDALEVYCKQSHRSKRDVLKEFGQVVYREAKSAIEAAAHDGTELPGWIESRITESGRALYAHLLGIGGVNASNGGGAVDTPAPRAVPFSFPPWMTDEPCQRCALPFQMRYSGPHSEAPICPRCCPPRGGSPDAWDTLYPRKKPTPQSIRPTPLQRHKKKPALNAATTLLAAVLP